MDTIMRYISIPLGYLMKWCWQFVGNYGLAIICFTLLTKLVLMPLSVWIQKNSILMVKIQPEINFLKANNLGNIDKITDEQVKLFKREHYHPMLSIIPLILQIILLLGVVYIIYRPMTFLFSYSEESINLIANYLGLSLEDSSFQLQIVEAIKNGTITASTEIAGLSAETLSTIVTGIQNFNISFLGLSLLVVPAKVFVGGIFVTIVAGLSSWLMCHTQNMSNVLQHEQSNWNKYGIMVISVGLSLYLGFFVPVGIAIYWIASNLMSIGQMYLLNWIINPKKYVDYEMLEQSRVALSNAKEYGKIDKKDPLYKQMIKKEKQDYKKFKSIANKHIVIYSERSGFYKYYKDIIEELIKNSNVTIHYVTNDYNDCIFQIAENQPRIKPYYISLKKLTLLMMLVETDIFIMTTPDLDKYYLKRSFIKKDIEYIYVPHDTMSVHMGFKEGALDAFDTIFCAGGHIKNEIKVTEEVYKVKQKKLVEFGFPLLDNLVSSVQSQKQDKKNDKKQILIAPSWQEDNLLDSCLDTLIEKLYSPENHLIVRPHPEYMKRYGYKIKKILEKYENYDKELLTFELDFSTNTSIYSSDILITDWSGISAEFAFATNRPVLFINTEMKVCNPNWQKINIEPIEITLRNIIGVSIDKQDVANAHLYIKQLIDKKDEYAKTISDYFKTFIYNHGTSAQIGAQYILSSLVDKKKNKKD